MVFYGDDRRLNQLLFQDRIKQDVTKCFESICGRRMTARRSLTGQCSSYGRAPLLPCPCNKLGKEGITHLRNYLTTAYKSMVVRGSCSFLDVVSTAVIFVVAEIQQQPLRT